MFQSSQRLVGGCSSLLGLLNLQAMTENTGKVKVLFITRDTSIDLRAVNLGNGVKVLRLGTIVNGRVLPQTKPGSLVSPQTVNQIVQSALGQIEPHDLGRVGGGVIVGSGWIVSAERQTGLGNVQNRHGDASVELDSRKMERDGARRRREEGGTGTEAGMTRSSSSSSVEAAGSAAKDTERSSENEIHVSQVNEYRIENS